MKVIFHNESVGELDDSFYGMKDNVLVWDINSLDVFMKL